MKSRLLFVTIGFLLILLTKYSNADEFKAFRVERKGIRIELNSKLELFHIMAYLSNSNYLNNFDFKYKSDINTFFALSKNDNSIQFVKKVLDNYHAHLSIDGLFFDDNFKQDTSFLQFLQLDDFGLSNSLINKSTILDSLNHAVESFARISQFYKFFENHSEYYQQKVDEIAKEVSGLEMIKDFETFWGTKKDSYTFVITMLEQDIHSYWYTSNNKSNCVFFLSPKFIVGDDAEFGNSDTTDLKEGKMAAKDYIYYGATHEIGHAFLNPIFDNLNKQIGLIQLEYTTADPTKVTFLCESFLRSLTAYFLSKNKFDEFAQMVIQGERQQGYTYNELIVSLINDYANNRSDYKTFNEYAPVFLDRLKHEVENTQQ